MVETEASLPPVHVSRVINAPREAVFAAWTDPAVLAKWFGPPEVTVTQAVIDARVGGAYRFVMQGDSGVINDNYGTYRDVVFPERLVFTWHIERRGGGGAASESLVTVELRACDAATTEITLTHERLTTEAATRGVRYGWSTSFEALDALLAQKLSTRG